MRIDEFGILIGLLLICVGLTIAAPTKFPLPTNLLMVVRQAANMGIMALGMVLVISMGDIDLSVASIYYLLGAIPVLHIDCRHHHDQQQAQRVHYYVPFATGDLLSSIYT